MSTPISSAARVLVTGGAGFIGSHLAGSLIARGHSVTVLDDLSTGRLENVAELRAHPHFHLIVDSVQREDVVDSLVREADAVLHLAAAVGVDLIIRDPVRVIETNVVGTRAVLRAANRHRRPVLLTSSSEIYGKSSSLPLREDGDRLLGPTTARRWSYATTKAAAEYLALAYHRQNGLPVIVARLFNTIGPRQSGQYGMVVPRFVRSALRGEQLRVFGDGQQRRCFSDVEDVVSGLIDLLWHPDAAGEVFNLGATREISILELAKLIWTLAHGRDPFLDDRISLVPYDIAYEPGFEDMPRRLPDVSKIRKRIGWEPHIPLEESLHRVIAYERAR